MRSTLVALGLVGVLSTACSGGDDSEPDGPAKAPPPVNVGDPASAVELRDSGFGTSRDAGTMLIAVLENVSSRGDISADVSFNVTDPNGNLISTESTRAGFTAGEQTIVVALYGLSIPQGAEVGAVDVSVVGDVGGYDEGAVVEGQLPALEGQVGESDFGLVQARYQLTNTLDASLNSALVTTVCYGSDGAIVGGGEDFTGVIAPGATAIVTTSSLIVSESPASCTAYPLPLDLS